MPSTLQTPLEEGRTGLEQPLTRFGTSGPWGRTMVLPSFAAATIFLGALELSSNCNFSFSPQPVYEFYEAASPANALRDCSELLLFHLVLLDTPSLFPPLLFYTHYAARIELPHQGYGSVGRCLQVPSWRWSRPAASLRPQGLLLSFLMLMTNWAIVELVADECSENRS